MEVLASPLLQDLGQGPLGDPTRPTRLDVWSLPLGWTGVDRQTRMRWIDGLVTVVVEAEEGGLPCMPRICQSKR